MESKTERKDEPQPTIRESLTRFPSERFGSSTLISRFEQTVAYQKVRIIIWIRSKDAEEYETAYGAMLAQGFQPIDSGSLGGNLVFHRYATFKKTVDNSGGGN